MSGALTICLLYLIIPSESIFSAEKAQWGKQLKQVRPTAEPASPKMSISSRFNPAYQLQSPQEYNIDMDLGVMYRRSGGNQCTVCFTDNNCFLFTSVRCEYYMETSKILNDDAQEVTSDNNPQLRAEVDSMVFSVMERARSDTQYQDCIPYVSKYTDCTKDTICTGCKTCDCASSGRWNCSFIQECRPELVKPKADHKTLYIVLGNLRKDVPTTNKRLKRDLSDISREINDDRMSHAKLAEWIYGEPTLSVDSVENTMYEQQQYKNTMYEQQQYKNIEPTRTIERNKKNDTRLLRYIINSLIHDTLPQVFKDTGVDYENNRVKRWISNQTKKIEKNTNKITFEELTDWISQVHPNIKDNTTGNISEINDFHVRDDKVDKNAFGTSKTSRTIGPQNAEDPVLLYNNPEFLAFEEVYNNIAVDNKNYSRRKSLSPMELNRKPGMDTDFNMYDDKYYFDETTVKPTKNIHIKNLVKELGVTIPPELSAVTEDITDYYIESVTEVVVDLLEAAKKSGSNSNNEKEYAEINNKIDNPHFLNTEEISIVNVMKRDVANIDQTLNTTNISQDDISGALKELNDNVLTPIDNIILDRRNEIDEMMKIRNNLIRFIRAQKKENFTKIGKGHLSVYQVDLNPHHHHEMHGLRTRASNITMLNSYFAKLKHDIYEITKDLIAIRKLYGDSSKVPDNLKFLIRALKHYIHQQGIKYRRINEVFSNTRRRYNQVDSVKSAIIKILELLDRNLPVTDSLAPLSPHSRRIIKRVIKRNYVDEFAAIGLRVYDPHYNLTNDLRNIGSKWTYMTSLVQKSSIFDKYYNLKKLHLVLSLDLAKMNDALALIDFARNRRMVPVDEALADNVMNNINKSLNLMTGTLQQTFTNQQGFIINQTDTKVVSSKRISLDSKHKKKESFLTQIKSLLQKSKKDIVNLLNRKVPKADIIKEIARKNLEQMNKRKLEDTMQKWQTNLNIVRKRRSASNFDHLRRRIKNIIPKYLRGKVSPLAMKKKTKKKNNTNSKKKITNTTHKNKLAANATKLTTKKPATSLKSTTLDKS